MNKIIIGFILVVGVLLGAHYLLKNKAVVSNEITATTIHVSSNTAASAKNPVAKRRHAKKKTSQIAPAEVAVSTDISAPKIAEVDISTDILAILPSAQEEVGNDQSVLQSRFQMNAEYFNNSGSPNSDVFTARLDGAINRRVAFRADLPYVVILSDKNKDGLDRGWGDVMLRGSAVLRKTPWVGFTGLCDFWLNTAEASNLGSGKNSVGPALGANFLNSYKDLMLSGFVQQKVSYSGDSSRSNINRSKFQITANKMLKEKIWAVLEPTIYVDWEHNRQTSCDLEFEAGSRLRGNWSAWFRPGVGLWGQGNSGGYNSYLSVGVRYIFGELIREKMLEEFNAQKENLIK